MRSVVPAVTNWFVRRLRTETRSDWTHCGFGASAAGSSSTPCGRTSRQRMPSKSASVVAFQYALSRERMRSTSRPSRGQSSGP